MNFGPAWTDERIANLKRMHADGLSASQIAGELGGITRNSVCGKIDRLGLSGKTRTSRPTTTKPKPAPAKRMVMSRGKNNTYGDKVDLVEVPEITDLPPDESEFACGLIELTDAMCRFPLGDTRDMATLRYCGAAANGPWCDRHHRIVYRPMARR